MSFTIASWNVESRLSERGISGRGSAEQIVAEIMKLDADVVVLPEAYDPSIGIDMAAAAALAEHYKTIIDVPYNDDEMKTDPYSPSRELVLRFMTRLAVIDSQVIRLVHKRDTPSFTIVDQTTAKQVTVFSLHLDDKHKERRLKQIDELQGEIKKAKTPVILIGDFNTSTGKSIGARFFHLPTTALLTHIAPSARIRDTIDRAIGMSSGDELRHLETVAGLQNADPAGRPTTTPKMFGKLDVLPSVRFLDIDHLYASPSVTVDNFTIMAHDGGADHRAISATISL